MTPTPAPKPAARKSQGQAVAKNAPGPSKNESSAAAPAQPLPISTIQFKQLDGAVLKDNQEIIKKAGKWPLLIDPDSRAATFLRFRDCNYLNAADPDDMQAERCRMAVIGALRYGKPVVVDMLDADLFESVQSSFNKVKDGFLEAILDKTVLNEDYFIQLLKPDKDDADYNKHMFSPTTMVNFLFILLTNKTDPPLDWRRKLVPIKIENPE